MSISRIYGAGPMQKTTIINYQPQKATNGMDSSVFKELFDKNKDGIVSKQELFEGMSKLNELNSTEQKKDDGSKAKNIMDGIGGLLGNLSSTAMGIFGAIKASKGEEE